MRKQIARAILVLIAVVGLSSTAWADMIPVGFVSYVQNAGEFPTGFFQITNQTGDNEQNFDFPILDFVSFNGMTLTVDGTLVSTIPADFTDANAGHPNYEFDSGTFFAPISALIGGAAPAGPFNLANGGLWSGGSYLLTGNFFLEGDLNGGGNTVDDGAFGIIYVEGRKVVPEPVSLSLLGMGVAGFLVRRRLAKR